MTIESIHPTKDTPISGEEERERAALIDLLVPAAMLAVALSAGVGSYLHLGLSPEFAAAIALTLFCLMLVGHVLLRASDPDGTSADPGRQMVASPMPSAPTPTKARRAAARKAATPPPNPIAVSADGADAQTPPKDLATAQERLQIPPRYSGTPELADALSASIEAAREAEVAAMRSFVETGSNSPTSGAPLGGNDTAAAFAPTAAEPASSVTAPHAPPLAATRSDAHRAALAEFTNEAWSYRPLDQRLPHTQPGLTDRDRALGSVRPSAFEPPASGSARTEAAIAEARRIDNILHRLATQIRSGQAASAATAPTGREQPDDSPGASIEGTPVAHPAAALHHNGAPADTQSEQQSALSDAVDALRATVEAMRQPGSSGGGTHVPVARQHGPVRDAAMLRLAAVAEALAAERAQVLLEPILKLSDEEARHFEVSVHLTSPGGELLDARSMVEGARGAGLLPLLDALGIRHSAGFALKLERRGRDGAVFSEVAGESLESESFVTDVAGRHAQGIADRLVLTFAQSEVRGLGPAQLEALSRLRQLGFRFAMQNVADLDMDFEALTTIGFEFVKLDAAVFLDGLELAGSHIPANDLTRHFVALGLDVIVGRIDAETVRARVLSCGAEFGQGPLFGSPRVIPTDSLAPGGLAA